MNIDIEKIENGFVVTIGSVKTFADVPEAVCGILAEWALKLCENKEKSNPMADPSAALALRQYLDTMRQMEETQKQNQYTPPWAQPPMIKY